VKHAWHQLVDIAGEEVPDIPRIMVVQNDSVEDAVLQEAARSDLLVMGLQHSGRRRRRFGELTLNIARKAECAVVLISKGFS
jgi:nucleotide-binding universal stress UspA family protein